MAALVVRKVFHKFAGTRLVADQVVIDEKYVSCARFTQSVEFACDLIQCLGARAATEE